MRFGFYKNLGGGVRVSVSPKSVGGSVGGKGWRVGINSRGRYWGYAAKNGVSVSDQGQLGGGRSGRKPTKRELEEDIERRRLEIEARVAREVWLESRPECIKYLLGLFFFSALILVPTLVLYFLMTALAGHSSTPVL